MPGLSLISYSRDDHAFVDELLGHAHNWRVPLLETVLVDDASAVPYTLPPGLSPHLNFRLLRIEHNVGAAQAKIHGLNAAKGEILFSLDADIRPHLRWLKEALPLLGEPGVGLVGAACTPARKGGYLAEALHRSALPPRAVTECVFTPGGCMLLRRETWEAIGGLRDYPPTAKAFEDVQISTRIRALGLRLLQDNRLPVYEARNLHRLAWCRREAGYAIPSVEAVIRKHGPEKYLEDLVPSLDKALKYFTASKNPILVYVFWLKTAHILQLADKDRLRPEERTGTEILAADYPEFRALLRDDLTALGQKPDFPAASSAALIRLARRTEEAGALTAMETWIASYREEDRTRAFDRHYMTDSVEK